MSHETCSACRFDDAAYDDATLLEALRALGPRWRSLLADAGTELRLRPEPPVVGTRARSAPATRLSGAAES